MLTNPAARYLQSSFALSWCPSMFFKEYIVCCVLEDGFIYQRDRMGKYVKVARLPEHKGLIRDVAWAPSMGRSYQLIATASKDGFVRIFKVFPIDKTEAAAGSSSSAGAGAGAGTGTGTGTGTGSETGTGFITGSIATGPGTISNGSNIHDENPNEDTDMNDDEEIISARAPAPLKVELLSQFDDHRGEVWRVSWNLTGTILASAGDDGKTRFWKSSYAGSFQSMAVVSAEQREDDA